MASQQHYQGRGGYRGQRRGAMPQRMGYQGSGRGQYQINSATDETSTSGYPGPTNSEALSRPNTMQRAKWHPTGQGGEEIDKQEDAETTSADTQELINQIRGAQAQARFRATFYPKFENEKSDQEIRMKMIDVVHSGKGVLEVSLKHSGSLFMYAGDRGGAFAKNSFGNLYTAVGVFVLGRTLQEAWGAQAAEKQREFNSFLEKEHICISMELVTAVLGDHGQRPLQDYVVVTAVTELKSKPRFYSTADLIAFCRQWRLPTNHVWLFSSRKSATSFFTAYDALCEEGTATTVSRVLDEVADLSVPATKSHMEVQGEILEGLVARIVTPQSVERLGRLLQEFPIANSKDCAQILPSLRTICAANEGNEKQQIKALLQHVGPDMCSDWSDWTSSQTNSSLLNKFLKAAPLDHMTYKFQEMIELLRERKMQVRYPCRVKGFDGREKKMHFKMTVHVLNDFVFRKYQKEMRYNPGLWPLYRGFFVDIYLFYGGSSRKQSELTALSEQFNNSMCVENREEDTLADESENLMLKLKFLTYKIRTFLIRNGLSTLFQNGFPAYRKYYLRQMEIWNTSPEKQRDLDQLLTEWAGYITRRSAEKRIFDHMYLSEAEPFLEQYAKRSLANSRLVGFTGSGIKMEDSLHVAAGQLEKYVQSHKKQETGNAQPPSQDSKTKGILVFFPGIPGCGKSALCKELLKGIGDQRPVHTLMGDLIKARYWPKLAEEYRKYPTAIMLADKNAPNVEVWRMIKDICKSTSTLGVPVIPDSEGTEMNPFSLDALALFMYRVLQRVNHPGNLDRNSPNAGYVLLMFYHLYDGQDRSIFEDTLKSEFGNIVKLPVLKSNRPTLPVPILGALTEGLQLYKQHKEKHGNKVDSTKGSFRQEWARWEKRLQECLFGNASYFGTAQVPFEEVVQSVRKQLNAIIIGEVSTQLPTEEVRSFKTVTYAAVTLPAKEIVDLIHKVALSSKELETYFLGKGIETTLKSAHVTLAHKASHGVATVAAYGEFKGLSLLVQLTALLFSNKMCALEAHILTNSKGILSRNEWPHITVWTAQGTKPKEANLLPQLVSRGEASRVEFSRPVVIPGTVELL